MADAHLGSALRLCPGHAHRPLDAPKGIHRTVPALVDDRLLDPVLASFRARVAVLSSEHAPLLLWRLGPDEHRSNLDSADRAAPHLQYDRFHPDGDGDVLSSVPARA